MTQTIAARVAARGRDTPRQVAMRVKRLGIWQEITWEHYAEQAALVAHGLADLGVAPGDRVAIQSENRPEWLYADVAAVAARAASVGLDPALSTDQVGELLADSQAKVLIAEDQEQVDKALAVKSGLDALEHIVYLQPRGVREYDDPTLVTWTDLLERGREHRERHPELLGELAGQVQPGDVVTVVYGATPARGVMLTAANVEFAIETFAGAGGLFGDGVGESDLVLSYLPLAGVGDRAASVWVHAAAATQLHFGESVETVNLSLREVQPTLLLGVPRVWQTLRATVDDRLRSTSRLKRANAEYWLGKAEAIGRERAANGGAHTRSTRLRYALGHVLFFRALRDRLGLRKCRHATSSASSDEPLDAALVEWFLGIGVAIHEVYGSAESSAVATANRAGRLRAGTVGEPQPGVELRLDESTGEILLRHPGVFAGYWGREQDSADVLGADGWLRTGDVGEWSDDSHLRIVGRVASA